MERNSVALVISGVLIELAAAAWCYVTIVTVTVRRLGEIAEVSGCAVIAIIVQVGNDSVDKRLRTSKYWRNLSLAVWGGPVCD